MRMGIRRVPTGYDLDARPMHTGNYEIIVNRPIGLSVTAKDNAGNMRLEWQQRALRIDFMAPALNQNDISEFTLRDDDNTSAGRLSLYSAHQWNELPGCISTIPSACIVSFDSKS